MDAESVKFNGVVAYIDYEDAGAMIEWLERVFGFEERARYVDKDGIVRQAEMFIGDTELWLAGHDPGYWAQKGHDPDRWLGVWVDDVDAHHDRVKAAGATISRPPEDQDYDVRTYQVDDPEGYHWGFMKRLGTGYIQRIPTEEGGWEEILASDRR